MHIGVARIFARGCTHKRSLNFTLASLRGRDLEKFCEPFHLKMASSSAFYSIIPLIAVSSAHKLSKIAWYSLALGVTYTPWLRLCKQAWYIHADCTVVEPIVGALITDAAQRTPDRPTGRVIISGDANATNAKAEFTGVSLNV